MITRADLEIDMTCGACPEQYDVYLKKGTSNELIGYLRLRHGYFYAEYIGDGRERVYESSSMSGDGTFNYEERNYYINKALDKIAKEINN